MTDNLPVPHARHDAVRDTTLRTLPRAREGRWVSAAELADHLGVSRLRSFSRALFSVTKTRRKCPTCTRSPASALGEPLVVGCNLRRLALDGVSIAETKRRPHSPNGAAPALRATTTRWPVR
jgi:hypothetical protein